ncbi:MAG: class IV adenylate cyclase [Chloroflexi bacterium]|nr:class IV adenylate cyclase [Chloroflexota bacterium]
MEREVEVKFRVTDLGLLRDRLAGLGAERGRRVFEENLVFDRPDGSLRAAGQLLRLRHAGDAVTLTFKSPLPSARFKVRREVEVRVDDFGRGRAILEALGFGVAATYEKHRETWRIGDAEVELDELPFGTFVEIEGSESAIEAIAAALSLDMAEAIVKDYLQLAREAAAAPPDRPADRD